MNGFRFAQYPSNSAVSSGVTLLVSAWFLVAAGAILADPAAPSAQRAEAQAAPLVRTADATPAAGPVIAPEAHFTITVEARRSAVL